MGPIKNPCCGEAKRERRSGGGGKKKGKRGGIDVRKRTPGLARGEGVEETGAKVEDGQRRAREEDEEEGGRRASRARRVVAARPFSLFFKNSGHPFALSIT